MDVSSWATLPMIPRNIEDQGPLINHLIEISIFGATVCTLMTAARLYIRRGRWWWDDWIASLSMTFMLFSTITLNLHLQYDSWLEKPKPIRIALFYLFNIGFYITMWSFRVSVILSLLRIGLFPRFIYPVIGGYITMCLILCCQILWVCEKQRAQWYNMQMPSCSLGRTAAIVNIIFSVLADSTLLFAPLYALWRTRVIPFPHRMRLGVVFGTVILVTIICMIHSAYVLNKRGLDLVLVTFLQLTVALIVCNLPVVSASLHRLYTRYRASKSQDPITEFVVHQPDDSSSIDSSTGSTISTTDNDNSLISRRWRNILSLGILSARRRRERRRQKRISKLSTYLSFAIPTQVLVTRSVSIFSDWEEEDAEARRKRRRERRLAQEEKDLERDVEFEAAAKEEPKEKENNLKEGGEMQEKDPESFLDLSSESRPQSQTQSFVFDTDVVRPPLPVKLSLEFKKEKFVRRGGGGR